MYNRYIRNQQGVFTRTESETEDRTAFCGPPLPPIGCKDSEELPTDGFLQRIFQKLGIENIDTGDLLLLLILFLLFSENGGKDEELLIALGLLLIL